MKIINPSDKYIIECEDLKLLTATIFILGEGNYGTNSLETDFCVPITIFDNSGLSFFKETFEEDFKSYFKSHKLEIGKCLDTITLGDLKDRKLFLSEMSCLMTEEEKINFENKWYEEKQTSCNEIGQRAKEISKWLKKS